MSTKRSWQRVDGVLLLDKPSGMSSNAALQAARRAYSAEKAGHTGTLDPLASGLLPLCFGDATKFSADLLDADKTYEAELLFGVTTDTGDAEGEAVLRRPVLFSRDELDTALGRFRGPISQVPPMYSALKRNGRPLYELARQGVEVERAPRAVTIHELELLQHHGDRCRLRVCCSKGTYIRTLAEDIGEALGCGAHLTALRRTAVGSLSLSEAVTLDRLLSSEEAERDSFLLSPDHLLQSLPMIVLAPEAATRFGHGNPVRASAPLGRCRVYENRGDGSRFLLGLGEADGAGFLHPRRLMRN